MVAMALFVVAVVLDLRQPPDRGCIGNAPSDRTYSVQLEEPVSAEVTSYHLAVSQQGRPVDGARVCVLVKMNGMPSMGVSDEARQVAPGRYQVSMAPKMGGAWKGTVLVAEPGRQAVAVPIQFDAGLGTPTNRGCGTKAVPDHSYSVKLEERARLKVSSYHLAVMRGGQPVRGARVCVDAEMNGMPAMGVTTDAKEVAPGSYEVKLTLGMGGAWKGAVIVAEPGRPAVTVPLSFIAV
jgi:hypothetical protein